MSESHSALTADMVDEMIAQHFPQGMGKARPTLPKEGLFLSSTPITSADIEAMRAHQASGRSLGVVPINIKALRHTHHRLAQMLAVGVDETVAAKLCNYSVSRVSILKSDPAFAELLAHYSDETAEAWADFVGTAANLSMDFLQELQRKLDEEPDKFTPQTIMEAIKVLGDRTGHAPVQKTQNVNINLNMGDKLKAARERANEAELRNITDGRGDV